MKKVDLDRIVASILSVDGVGAITAEFLRQIMLALIRGETVLLNGFGTLRMAKERSMPVFHHTNARTGNKKDLPLHGRYSVYFKKSRTFRELIQYEEGENYAKHNKE